MLPYYIHFKYSTWMKNGILQWLTHLTNYPSHILRRTWTYHIGVDQRYKAWEIPVGCLCRMVPYFVISRSRKASIARFGYYEVIRRHFRVFISIRKCFGRKQGCSVCACFIVVTTCSLGDSRQGAGLKMYNFHNDWCKDSEITWNKISLTSYLCV